MGHAGGWSLRAATPAERRDWDAGVEANPDGGQWTQGAAFAALKAPDRLTPRFLVLERDGDAGPERIHVLALEHRSVAGRFWYLPTGPGVASIDDLPDVLDAFRAERHGLLRGVFALKVEPFVVDTPEHRAVLQDAGLRASAVIQKNTHTVLVPLDREPDAIFAGFSKSLRNHIRSADRNGYRVEKVEPGEDTYRTMYRLMQTISGGRGSELTRPYAYYHRLWSELCARGQGHFWFGYDGAHEGPQASAFMIGYGRTAIAKDGGSVPDRAIRGGAALMRWTAMQWFRSRDGRTIYDAYVTPPSWLAHDPEQPMHGPGIFKLQFGPIVDHLPSHDLVLDERRFQLFVRLLLPLEWRVRRRPGGIW
ncbi:lipid II:glycine glycyltransferase FemX [Agrococcus jejuensis]|uniref:Acetyltransferase (GNAT) domain-containing protein n=1 Tax=Agrococcus jejuensis TaxID=399736 RepID=A0A1G8A7C1_9MICO|nr:GNAT family N-acetyltransferase [Agrococcus jejuensis]SDH16783.1 Acetyltransferase (GNAT) domain-containing protein [Agrococcus jejuensis]